MRVRPVPGAPTHWILRTSETPWQPPGASGMGALDGCVCVTEEPGPAGKVGRKAGEGGWE